MRGCICALNDRCPHVQELSRKGLAASDVDAALRDLFGERMTLELEFSENVEDRRPTGPDAQFGVPCSHRPAGLIEHAEFVRLQGLSPCCHLMRFGRFGYA